MTWRTKLFHLWFRFQRPMTLGVRALAFDAQGALLLVRHTYVPGWHLCGGGVETGDTFEQTLAKELWEEANVELGDDVTLQSLHFNRHVSKRDHVAVYVAKGVVQRTPKLADREIAEARFFALDALPEGTTKSTLKRLQEYQSGTKPDPYW